MFEKTVEKMDQNYLGSSNTQNYEKVKFRCQNYFEYWKWRQNAKSKIALLRNFIITRALNLI